MPARRSFFADDDEDDIPSDNHRVNRITRWDFIRIEPAEPYEYFIHGSNPSDNPEARSWLLV